MFSPNHFYETVAKENLQLGKSWSLSVDPASPCINITLYSAYAAHYVYFNNEESRPRIKREGNLTFREMKRSKAGQKHPIAKAPYSESSISA